jgi:hypothetical protein
VASSRVGGVHHDREHRGRSLRSRERLRLVEKIAHDLSASAPIVRAPIDVAAPTTMSVPERPRLTTLSREVWESGLGVVALGGDALADSEAYYDAP